MAARKLTSKQLERLTGALHTERAELTDQVADLSAEAAVDRWRSDGSGDDPADRGAASSERETAATLSDHARRLLDDIDEALRRVDEGSYGQCTQCGRNIGFARLEVIPAAALCLDCKRRAESRR
jgi:DnaK suppressor protein